MARPTIWLRRVVEGGLHPDGNLHAHIVTTLNPGETIGRVRFNFQGFHAPEFGFPGEPFSLQVGVGLITQPSSVTAGFVPRPISDFQDDWMWWECPTWRSEFAYVNSNDVVTSTESYPGDPGERDVQAQRGPMTVETNLWIMAEAGPSASAQTFHFFSFSASVLVLLPA